MNDNLLILHVGTSIILIGTAEQCQERIDQAVIAKKLLCWSTSTPAEYGEKCYDQGLSDGNCMPIG